MWQDLTRLFRHTFIYAVGNVGQGALQFLLLPIYTRLLTPADYGTLEILTVFGTFLGIFMQLGLRSGFTWTYLYLADEADSDDRRQVLGTVLSFLFGWSTFVLLLAFTLAPHLSGILLQDTSQAHLVRLAIGWTWGSMLFQIPQAYYINNERSKTFVVLSTLLLLLNLGLSVYWVVIVRIGVEGALWARLVASAAFGVGLCAWLLWRQGSGFRWQWLKPMLRFGIPVVAGALAAAVINLSDRFFVQFYTGLSDVGIYATANKVAAIMSLTMVGAFHGAYVPFQYQMGRRTDHRRLIGRLMVIVTAVFCLASLALGLFARDLLRILVAPNYYDAHRVVIFLVLSHTAYITAAVFFTGINLSGKPEFGIPITVAAGLANLALNFALIPRWGILGAAIATFLTHVLRSAMNFFVAQRLYPIDYAVGKAVLLVSGTLAAYFLGIGWRAQATSPVLDMAGSVLVLFAAGTMMILFLTTSSERRWLWSRMTEKLRVVVKF